MEQVILWILAAGAAVGGLDLLFGNRFGLGARFEAGFQLLGPTALSMAGILCLAPLLAQGVEVSLAPLWTGLGLDPAMLGGILAIDMGGYQMATALAAEEAVGRYAGILVTATLGCTVSFTIPAGIGMVKGAEARDFFRGLLIGLAVLPAALLAGGICGGLSWRPLVVQTLPLLLFSALLVLGLHFFPRQMLVGFSWFARLIRWLSIIGLTLGAVQYIAGVTLLPELMPIEDAMRIVSGIGVVLLGSLPAAELLQRALRRPLQALGRRTGMRDSSLAALLIGFVSAMPALAMLKDMDSRGRTVNAAFLVCGASALAAHLGFTLSAEPSMLLPLLLTKLLGSLLAAALALLLTRPSGRAH